MHLTRAADYAVRLMLHLASVPDDKRVSRHELARGAEVPVAFVAKLLQRLVAAGLVRSHAGRRGGFVLARPRPAISMLDIVRAVEGEVCLNRCLPPMNACHRAVWCPAHVVWAEAQEALHRILQEATLERLTALPPMLARVEAVRVADPDGPVDLNA